MHDEGFLGGTPLFALSVALPALASDHTPPPVQPATSFAAVEVHTEEQWPLPPSPTIQGKKSPSSASIILAHDVMPVRLIVTNLGDRPISLADARILFETAEGDRIRAAEPEDVERTDDAARSGKDRKIPMPAPLPPIHIKAQGQHQGDRGRL